MGTWFKKLRGLFGLSLTGASVGAVLGSGWVLISGLFGHSGLNAATFAWGAGLWALLGGVAAGGVGIALAVLHSGRTTGELSTWRAGLYGAFFGAVAPLLLIGGVLLNGGVMVATGEAILGVLTVVGISAGVGALLGSGVVAAAKNAATRELGAAAERRRILASGPFDPVMMGSGQELMRPGE